ncbi:hypothetical protein E7744_02750 [Citricoccus sp. SGAir0253]|uniref:hypothetical protein n=1 Tax=Citricoccus sp. SGAir0253 TaxID=2567881 RepID=UPI0010CCE5B7|nr:hypothetical protein [Citricoccus sp. SGAir0253]QCU77255.1 hypothetical protein E7744_02750 [Citricoccus sp. SGAir0253]
MAWESLATAVGAWDWGTVPEWFAAVGTVGAVGAALIANRINARERADAARERREAAEDRNRFRRIQEEEAAERRQELARQVSFTFTAVALRDEFGEPTNEVGLDLKIVNHGPSPISHVQIFFGEVTYYARPLDDLRTIPPNGEVTWGTRNQDHFRDRPRLKLYFRDARGTHWITDLAGYLWEHEDIGREPRSRSTPP